jgi:hypothetical protein
MTMRKTILFAVLACILSAPAGAAGAAGPMRLAPADSPVVRVDWQTPEQLPPRFRDHCTAENFTGRPYCSGHCGIDYQFYYCTPAAFGCCRLGHGYCDWDGVLRCHP